jgi:hypothetical protein
VNNKPFGEIMSKIMDAKINHHGIDIILDCVSMSDPETLCRLLQYVDGLVCSINTYQDGVDFVTLDWGMRCWAGYNLADKRLTVLNHEQAKFKLQYINGWEVIYVPLDKESISRPRETQTNNHN